MVVNSFTYEDDDITTQILHIQNSTGDIFTNSLVLCYGLVNVINLTTSRMAFNNIPGLVNATGRLLLTLGADMLIVSTISYHNVVSRSKVTLSLPQSCF